MLNTLQFKEWLETHAYLCEGVLSFKIKGIRVTIPKGADAWDKAGFSIRAKNNQPQFLDLLYHEEVLVVRRDLHEKKEWMVGLLDSQIAAQNS
jgi:hypothetical protein